MNTRKTLPRQIGSDPVEGYLKATKQPLTRENYLIAAYPDRDPNQPLGAEEEAMLPDRYRLKT